MTYSKIKKPISLISEIYLGGTPKTSILEYWGGKIKWASARDIANCPFRYIRNTAKTITLKGIKNSAAKLLPKNTIVITARGTVGKICMLPEEMAFNQTCYGLIANEEIDPNFLYYSLKYEFNQIIQLSYGTVFDTITKRTFNELTIWVPDYFIQSKIAKILSNIDDKIEVNTLINSVLEKINEVLFKHWFIDFEFPDKKGNSYQSSGGAMIETSLGDIPKEFKIVNLEEVVKIVDCLHGKKPENIESNRVLLQVYNIGENGILTFDKLFTVSESDYSEWTKKIELTSGDCIISKTGRVGAVAQIPQSDKYGIGRNLVALRPIDVTATYLLQYLLSKYGREEIEKLSLTGTILRSIHVKYIKEIRIVVPPKEIMTQYEKISRPLRELIESNIIENINLSKLRDVLLPRLMSGEIRVPVEDD